MANETIKNLSFRVVEFTTYDDRVIHIENVSYDMALTLAQIMNESYDSYFNVESIDDNHTK